MAAPSPPPQQQQQQQHQHQHQQHRQPPPFAQKQAAAIAKEQAAELKQLTSAAYARYLTGEVVVGPYRERAYPAEHDAGPAGGRVKAAPQHPLVSILTTPKLPPELAAYVDPK